MKSSKKSFNFMGFIVEVYITDSAPNGFREDSVAGVYPHEDNSPVFKIWFRKTLTQEMLVHECWHLYMTMLMVMDSSPHYFEELNNEIYAYNFHSLVMNVLDTATGMKVYADYFMNEETK